MYARFKLVFRLFKKPFALVGVLYLVALVMFLSVIGLKESYKMNLQNEFATKQPHIKVSFINDNKLLKKSELESIKKELYSTSKKIATVSEYVTGHEFFGSTGTKKSGGSANFQGDIKVIGLGEKEFVYDFYDSAFSSREPFNIAYTPLEFIYTFKNEPNSVVFNTTLFNSYFPVIASIEKFTFTSQQLKAIAKFTAHFNDFDKKAILYTNINFANILLNNPTNKIDGFYINAKKLEDIESLTQELKEQLPPEKFIVKSWLEDRHKQFMMFYIFEVLSLLIVGVIILLSLLFILLLLYNAIVKKSYQLSVLLTIGYRLQNEIFIFVLFVMLLDTSFALGFVYLFLEFLTTSLSLPYSKNILIDSGIYIIIINLFFTIISYFLIKNAYSLKAKSVF